MFGGKKPKARTLAEIHNAFDKVLGDIDANARLTAEEKEFARNELRLDYRNALKAFYHSLF